MPFSTVLNKSEAEAFAQAAEAGSSTRTQRCWARAPALASAPWQGHAAAASPCHSLFSQERWVGVTAPQPAASSTHPRWPPPHPPGGFSLFPVFPRLTPRKEFSVCEEPCRSQKMKRFIISCCQTSSSRLITGDSQPDTPSRPELGEPPFARCHVSPDSEAEMRGIADQMRSPSCPWCKSSTPLEWFSKPGTHCRDHYRCAVRGESGCGYEEVVVHPAGIMRADRARCLSGAAAHHLCRVDNGHTEIMELRCAGCSFLERRPVAAARCNDATSRLR